MNKETYIKRRTDLESELSSLKEDYIKTNAEFQIGDNLKFTDRYSPDGILVQVMGFKIGYQDKVEYVLNKVKKDGSLSSVRARYYNEYKLEKV